MKFKNWLKKNKKQILITLACLVPAIIITSIATQTGDVKRNDYIGGATNINDVGISADTSTSTDSFGSINNLNSSTSKNETYSDVDVEDWDTNLVDKNKEETDSENSVEEYGDTLIVNEKLVYRCNMKIETLDYDNTYNSIKQMLTEFNGIIESEESYENDYDWYTDDSDDGYIRTDLSCRIPSDKYDEFVSKLNCINDKTKVISKSVSTDNITQTYIDKTSELEALEVEQENLLTMLNSAYSVSDMITIQDRLSTVRYEINKLKTEVRKMDMDVAYSYVNIILNEVEEYSKEDELGFWAKLWKGIKNSFSDSFEALGDIIIFFITMIPVVVFNVLPVALIIYIIIKIIQKISKRIKSKRKIGKDTEEIDNSN